MSDLNPYAVYWSIYTDLRGRRQFRDLYWDKLKDLIGRPAKLVSIERESDLYDRAPKGELRCHVWRFFSTETDASAIGAVVRTAMQVAPCWQVLGSQLAINSAKEEQLIELLWYRHWAEADQDALPLPKLTTILLSLNWDTGFRIRPGYTICGRGEHERPADVSRLRTEVQPIEAFTAKWQLQVQTSNKRKLMDTHWPILQQRFGDTAEMIDLEKRETDVGPFKFLILQRIENKTEDEAILFVLSQAAGMHVRLTTKPDGSFDRLIGERRGNFPIDAHLVLGFELTKSTAGLVITALDAI